MGTWEADMYLYEHLGAMAGVLCRVERVERTMYLRSCLYGREGRP